MSLLPEAAKAYIGLEATTEIACERVERGAVRRYAQAIMDEDPIFREPCATNARYGGPVAPPIFPTHMFYWRDFGMPECVADAPPGPACNGGHC